MTKKYFTVNRKISMSSIRWCDSREKLYAGELIVFVLATCSTRLGAPYYGGNLQVWLASGEAFSTLSWGFRKKCLSPVHVNVHFPLRNRALNVNANENLGANANFLAMRYETDPSHSHQTQRRCIRVNVHQTSKFTSEV